VPFFFPRDAVLSLNDIDIFEFQKKSLFSSHDYGWIELGKDRQLSSQSKEQRIFSRVIVFPSATFRIAPFPGFTNFWAYLQTPISPPTVFPPLRDSNAVASFSKKCEPPRGSVLWCPPPEGASKGVGKHPPLPHRAYTFLYLFFPRVMPRQSFRQSGPPRPL